MFILGKRIGLATLVGLLAFGMMAPSAPGQVIRSGSAVNVGNTGVFPFFQVAPGLNLQQAAFNIGTFGRAYSQFPPYALPYAPPYALGYTPGTNLGVLNTGAPTFPNVFFNPALSPVVNPFNPYALSNPFTATLTSTGTLPYSPIYNPYGYGNSIYSSGYGGQYGYSPYGGYGYGDPYGGYLMGGAAVINAQGRFMVNYGQYELTRQQIKREEIENRRRYFDWYKYWYKNRITSEQIRQDQIATNLQRYLNQPPETEIWAATALNAILKDARKLKDKGTTGPQIPLEERTLQHINVTTKEGAGNVGLLKDVKDDGHLKWPVALQADEYKNDVKSINTNLPDAIRDAIRGHTDASTVRVLTGAAGNLREQLVSNVRDIPPAQYQQAKRFITNLDGAITALQQPNVEKLLNMDWVAKVRTVADLIDNMKGLQFAPAVEGQEEDYMTLYNALASYDIGARGQMNQVAADKQPEK